MEYCHINHNINKFFIMVVAARDTRVARVTIHIEQYLLLTGLVMDRKPASTSSASKNPLKPHCVEA